MGAGKTTIGEQAAGALGRRFVDIDGQIEADFGPIAEIFARDGEALFRERETRYLQAALATPTPLVIALGAGGIEQPPVRELLRGAFTVRVDVELDTAWERTRGSGRPLARDESEFRGRYARRAPLYEKVADAAATDADGVVLASAGIHVGVGSLDLLGELVPGAAPVALVSDPHVAGIYGAAAQLALGARLASTHEVPPGEQAKTVAVAERLWNELELERGGILLGLGGGCTTDVAGFVAATYLRGIPWVAAPTSLVGQVDAAIGGKTALDLAGGKNLVGAFHWPARVVVDPGLLATLPERERAEGMSEVVKTGLLAGLPLWELPEPELVRRCAAFKAAVCLRDPRDEGERAILNLGHTFAHALEAAAGYGEMTHGRAVALGLRAAIGLNEARGDDTEPQRLIDELLAPRPVKLDRERAWAALLRDKKARDGRIRLVLLPSPGSPLAGVEVPEAEVRRALDDVIAD